MRKIKEFLRLTHHGGLSDRQIGLSLDISRSTVKEYRAQAQRAGLSWPLPDTLTDEPWSRSFSRQQPQWEHRPNRSQT